MKHLVQIGSLMLLFVMLSLMPVKAQEAEWQTIHDADGITFSYKIVNCAGPDFIVCQVSNTNAQAVSILFQLKGNDGAPLPLAERHPLLVEAGQIVTSSCEAPMPGLFIPKVSPEEETLEVEIETHLIK